jgi:hypothetical protein
MTEFVTYTAAIAATDNSTAVVGTGTSFIIDGVRPGDIAYFLESTGPVGYPIEAVGSATSLTLSCNYEGSTGGSKSVIIARRYGEEKAADTFRLLNSYVQALEDTISVSQAGIRYVYSSTTTMSAPASGTFRLNNVSAASVTAIAFSDLCGETGNPDASAFINSWDDSSAVTKGILYFKKAGDPSTFMVYAITGLTDNTGWSQLAVSYVTGNGSLVDADAIRIDFYRTGNDGFEAGTRLTYSTTTTDSDPGAGTFRFNNATFASITQIYIDNTDAGGSTITALLDLVDDSTTTAARGIIRLQKTGDPTVYRDFTVNGAVVDGTGYRKIPVTPIQSSGTWTNGNSFSFTFFRTGNAGADGFQPGYRFTFNTTITDADPGAGTISLNNATHSSATFAYVDNLDSAGATITAWLDGLDDSTQSNHRGYLRIQRVNDPNIYREYVVNGAVVDGTGYRKIPISHVASNGVLASSDAVVLTFSRSGNIGINGVDGVQSGYRLTYSTTVTDADPGIGFLRFNNATFASVTQLFIDDADINSASITAWLDSLDDANSAVRGTLRLEKIGDATVYREFNVTGTVVNGTGYRKVSVTPLTSNGTLNNNDVVAATWFRTGDAGIAIISDGDKGDISVTGSGTTWSIESRAVSNPKLAAMVQSTLKGRPSGAGTGDPEDLTPAQARAILGVREALTANRTYWVRNDGSNSNDGLTNAAGGAFATLQKAYDVIVGLDLAGFTATIQYGVAGQTITSGLKCSVPPVGGNVVLNIGGSTIDVATGSCVENAAPFTLTVQNGTLRATAGNALYCNQVSGATIDMGPSLTFGACAAGYHKYALGAGTAITNKGLNAYSITGSAIGHNLANLGGTVIEASITVTLTGTPAFSFAFTITSNAGTYSGFTITYSGAASAGSKRYDAALNGVIQTYGGGASYFPGGVGGTNTTGGEYA